MVACLSDCRAKNLHRSAIEKEVPAIIGGGVYPGLSNVMAAHIIATNKKEYDQDGFHKQADADAGTEHNKAV